MMFSCKFNRIFITGNINKFVGKNYYRKLSNITIPHKRKSYYSSDQYILAGFSVVIWALLSTHTAICNDEVLSDSQFKTTQENIYRKEEVAKHTSKEIGVWVIYDDGVYDITKFITNHPGGQEKIMLAAGSDIAPYWNLYQQHYNSSKAMDLLQSMRIGTLHHDDVASMQKENSDLDVQDPYMNDPTLSNILFYHGNKPINAESPPSLATDHWITPIDLWFARNHHPIIADLTNNFELNVEWDPSVLINNQDNSKSLPTCEIILSLDDIKQNFKPITVVSTLQCGGNRRAEMNEIAPTNGVAWCNAISTAKWKGVRLRDILLAAGVNEDDVYNNENSSKQIKHVHFIGADGMQASIPIKKALSRDGDVLLAYEMNDVSIPSQHGAPLRAIVPGHVGVRNVKWLKSIKISNEEATGTWQRGMAYKGFGPSVKSLEGIDVEKIPSLQEQPVQSIITIPNPSYDKSATSNTLIYAGEPLSVQGYSYSGGGRGIVRVDVSIDGGETWKTAVLTEGSHQPIDKSWAWTFWKCDFDIPLNLHGNNIEIICKATDVSYNVQPDTVKGIWNLRGINNNAWHRIHAQILKRN